MEDMLICFAIGAEIGGREVVIGQFAVLPTAIGPVAVSLN